MSHGLTVKSADISSELWVKVKGYESLFFPPPVIDAGQPENANHVVDDDDHTAK